MNLPVLTAASGAFESARQVDSLPLGHRCRQLHGHSFSATVLAALPTGWGPFPGGEIAALRERLNTVLAPLNYAHLNGVLAQPTDENLARWVRRELALPGVQRVAIQSTLHQGVDLDQADRAHVWRRYRFQAAHRLPHVAPGHKCGRLHGHGFEVIIHANQDLNGRDLSIDYDHIDRLWAPLQALLDHQCLNDLPGLENPTSEMLSSWIWGHLKAPLPALSGVTVYETASCGATYDGAQYRIWKDLTLDSAVQLKRAPSGLPAARVHGHTFTLRLQLSAPLDTLMGWTIDFGDVKAQFDPLFKALDHRPLHEMPGLADADTTSIAQWIYAQARSTLPQLVRVDLYEAAGCGVHIGSHHDGPALPVQTP